MTLLLILLMMKVLFSFLLKLNSNYLCAFTSTIDTEAESPHNTATVLKLC